MVETTVEGARDIDIVLADEWIGRAVTIIDCTDPTWVGRTGTIIDETKNTFLIECGDGRRRIAKHTATFQITVHKQTRNIQGSLLRQRPEERIKRLR
jgi:RNase P/RNase MRP subunit p29